MKIKHIALSATMLVSISTFAQKDELKSLKKIYAKEEIKGNDLAEYKALVTKAESLSSEEGDKIYTGFYKSMIPILEYMALDKTMSPQQIQIAVMKFANSKSISDLANGLNSTLDYEKKTGKKIYTDDINETITSFKPELINFASSLGQAKKDKEASEILYSIYSLDKKDVDMLFYAASYAVKGEDYDAALKHYYELKKLNYSGEKTIYYAVNKTSKQEENFGSSKNLRDLSITGGTHEKPRDEKLPSQRGEIYKNVALILVQQGKTQEAIAAVQEAKKENPTDDSLALTEADLYMKINDYDTYTKLVNEILAKNPNNAELIYNLGVLSANANKLDDAKKYYLRALEIKPDYFEANLNISELMLRGDEKIVKEMNSLGTSDKDNKRYDVLKVEREKNFKSILPYLEKAYQLKPDDEAAKSTLMSVYNALEMTDKYKELKAKK